MAMIKMEDERLYKDILHSFIIDTKLEDISKKVSKIRRTQNGILLLQPIETVKKSADFIRNIGPQVVHTEIQRYWMGLLPRRT